MSPEKRERIIREVADALEAEVQQRGQYYGLDNWDFREVVVFVLDRAVEARDRP